MQNVNIKHQNDNNTATQSKIELENIKLHKQIKVLLDDQQKHASSNKDTESQYMLPSEFKEAWNEMVKTYLPAAFIDLVDSPLLYVNAVSELCVLVLAWSQKKVSSIVADVMKLLKIQPNYTNLFKDYMLALMQRFCDDIFVLSQDDMQGIVNHFEETYRKCLSFQYTSIVSNINTMSTTNLNTVLQFDRQSICDQVDQILQSDELQTFISKYARICVYTLLHKDADTIESNLQSNFESRHFSYQQFDKQKHHVIDGFAAKEKWCLVVMPPLTRKGFDFQGCNPGVLILDDVWQMAAQNHINNNTGKQVLKIEYEQELKESSETYQEKQNNQQLDKQQELQQESEQQSAKKQEQKQEQKIQYQALLDQEELHLHNEIQFETIQQKNNQNCEESKKVLKDESSSSSGSSGNKKNNINNNISSSLSSISLSFVERIGTKLKQSQPAQHQQACNDNNMPKQIYLAKKERLMQQMNKLRMSLSQNKNDLMHVRSKSISFNETTNTSLQKQNLKVTQQTNKQQNKMQIDKINKELQATNYTYQSKDYFNPPPQKQNPSANPHKLINVEDTCLKLADLQNNKKEISILQQFNNQNYFNQNHQMPRQQELNETENNNSARKQPPMIGVIKKQQIQTVFSSTLSQLINMEDESLIYKNISFQDSLRGYNDNTSMVVSQSQAKQTLQKLIQNDTLLQQQNKFQQQQINKKTLCLEQPQTNPQKQGTLAFSKMKQNLNQINLKLHPQRAKQQLSCEQKNKFSFFNSQTDKQKIKQVKKQNQKQSDKTEINISQQNKKASNLHQHDLVRGCSAKTRSSSVQQTHKNHYQQKY